MTVSIETFSVLKCQYEYEEMPSLIFDGGGAGAGGAAAARRETALAGRGECEESAA